jgi:hypothetical protein
VKEGDNVAKGKKEMKLRKKSFPVEFQEASYTSTKAKRVLLKGP